MTYLQFDHKTSSNRLALSSKQLPLLQDQAIGTFYQSIAPQSKPLPFFRQAISSHRSTRVIATLFQEIALVSWLTSPSDCLEFQAIAHLIQAIACYALSPSDCHFWASDWLLADSYSRVLLGFRHLSTP